MEPIRLKDKTEERHTSLMWSDLDKVWSILTPRYLRDFWKKMSESRILMEPQSTCWTREAVPTVKTFILSALSMSLLLSIQHEIALIQSWITNLIHSKSSTKQLLDNSVSSAYLWNEQLCWLITSERGWEQRVNKKLAPVQSSAGLRTEEDSDQKRNR